MTLVATVGCSSKSRGQRLVPVSGVVHFNGQPLADAQVTFTNSKANLSAYARTDANGKFTLTTFESGDGAVPGPQKVSVIKVQTSGQSVRPDAMDSSVDQPKATGKSAEPQQRWLIPERYGSVETSGLTAEIAESGNKDIVLELQGEAGNNASKPASARPAANLRPDR